MPRDPARVDIDVHFTLAFLGSLNISTRFCQSEDGVLPSSYFGLFRKFEMLIVLYNLLL